MQANLKHWESWFSLQNIYFGRWHIRMKDDIQLDISARHIIILSIEDVLSGDQLSFFGFFICLLQQNTQALLLHKQGNWWLAMGISLGWVWWGYGGRRTLRRDNWGDFSSPPGTTTTTSTNNSNKQTGECPSLELSRWDCVPHITTPLKEPCHGIYRNSNRETHLVSAVSLTSYIFARDSCVLRGNFVSTN